MTTPEQNQKEQEERLKSLNSSFTATRKGLPDHVVVLVIAYDTKMGNVQVMGPIANKHMAYGMLGLARDCIETYNREHIAGVIKP
jgi:ABC-type arginine transport system permease subunit